VLNYVEDPDAMSALPALSGALTDRRLHEFEVADHKPLGCTVEESLADEADGARHVFVAEVERGGNAHEAGLRAGDVIVQLSGTFHEVVDVAGLGIEKIRSLVSGRPAESPLVVRVARGSDVMARHEVHLVESCIIGDDAATVECITYIYAADDDPSLYEENPAGACAKVDGTECMLDSMWKEWSGDLVVKVEEKEEEAHVEQVEKKKEVAPWNQII